MYKKLFSFFIVMAMLVAVMLTACERGEQVNPMIQPGSDNSSSDGEKDVIDSNENEVEDKKNKGQENEDSGDKESEANMILVNQIGYKTDDPKMAIFTGKVDEFNVIDKDSGNTVFTGQVTGPRKDGSTGHTVYYGDFSQLNKPGTYYISIYDKVKSPIFSIDERPYKDLKNALLKSFYYQRCGMALEEKYAGVWHHDECHIDDGYVYSDQGQYIDTTGGWHDAGDYGKYVVPAAKAVADLMLAYQLFPGAFKEQINIPESGNGIPDILNEVRYELEWMLKMQDSKSGGVYHKIATLKFPAFIMPEADKAKRYINDISATATADFAAAMAMGYRVYREVDKTFADKMINAAKKAWNWLEANPEVPGFKNPPGVNSGEYGDSNSNDERFWAAAELYSATEEEKYHEYIKARYSDNSFSKVNFSWASVGGYGTVTYLMMDQDKTDSKIYDHLKSQFIQEADKLTGISSNDGYRVVLKPNEYNWGSNGTVMDRAMHLILSNIIAGNNEYIDVARDQLHYILGRNSLNQCYVTGFGSNSVMNPHHRPSGADGIEQPVPGMLSGGPNSRRQDPTVQKNIPLGTPLAKVFIDDTGSYSTNEIAIYWNSPAVFVAAYFDRDMIQDMPSLKEEYEDYFSIGAAVSGYSITASPHKEFIAKHFDMLTAENAMKFEPIHPENGIYYFEQADRIVEFAQQNSMKMIGHTLIWHNQTPDWVFKDADGNFVTREVLLKRMEEHIKTVVVRYKGKVYGWDVVNEAIEDSPPYGLRDTMWRKIIGDDYIEWAFKFAHEADPDAELYYNDYNTETSGKRDAIYNLVKGLKEKGIPIDAVGLQSHNNLYYPTVHEIENSIKKFTSLGIKVNISELDVDLYKWGDKEDRYRDGVPDDILQLQADRYGELFELYRSYKDVIGRVTFWGYYDGGSWLNNFPVKNRTNYPLLFDRQFKPKLAFWSVVNFE